MFDTPDLLPLCFAPPVAVLAGILVFVAGSAVGSIVRIITKKRISFVPWVTALSLVSAPITCVASAALGIGENSPAPWFTPDMGSIVGTWELTSAEITHLQQFENTPVLPHEFVFQADGTFHMTRFPAFWGRYDPTLQNWKAKYVSGSGKWFLDRTQGGERLEWTIFAIFQSVDDQSNNRLVRFYFEGHLPPYMLISIDGERGSNYELVKK